MYYCSTSDVYATSGLTTSEVSEKTVELLIKGAQAEVDRFTNTTYWNELANGTASAGANTSLTDSSKTFAGNEYKDSYLWIYSGTGSGQVRSIASNTGTVITVDTAWDTNPDTTSKYRVFYSATNPYVENELRDGEDASIIFLDKYPVQVVEAITIDSVSVTPSNTYLYKNLGKIKLNQNTSEVASFTSKEAQLNDFTYWYGVYPMPYEISRYCMVVASLKALQAQMGTTHNVPSTYSLPEGSVTIGQAYVNIRGTYDVLMKEKDQLERSLIRYFSVA